MAAPPAWRTASRTPPPWAWPSTGPAAHSPCWTAATCRRRARAAPGTPRTTSSARTTSCRVARARWSTATSAALRSLRHRPPWRPGRGRSPSSSACRRCRRPRARQRPPRRAPRAPRRRPSRATAPSQPRRPTATSGTRPASRTGAASAAWPTVSTSRAAGAASAPSRPAPWPSRCPCQSPRPRPRLQWHLRPWPRLCPGLLPRLAQHCGARPRPEGGQRTCLERLLEGRAAGLGAQASLREVWAAGRRKRAVSPTWSSWLMRAGSNLQGSRGAACKARQLFS
mmetsp:Transcript_51717/g.165554  ORF Transcript_51717/g.165554 Transcript_51717/m.165554 type:complete len:283 (-) Transcript_51717:372-1220(-)